MTPEEQINFLKFLADQVLKDMIAKIESGKVPADWNGGELRKWMADECKDNIMGLSTGRVRAYNNARIVNNL